MPVAGGAVAVYLSPPKPLMLSAFFASPRLIPLRSRDEDTDNAETQMVINSPDEEDRTLLSRIIRFLRDTIWEPFLTARRFVHLFFIFIPVIVSSPAILFGQPEKRFGGERSGAIWWYDYLVIALQRAGPTFIKVCPYTCTHGELRN